MPWLFYLLYLFTPLSLSWCLPFHSDAAHCRAIDYPAHRLSEWIWVSGLVGVGVCVRALTWIWSRISFWARHPVSLMYDHVPSDDLILEICVYMLCYVWNALTCVRAHTHTRVHTHRGVSRMQQDRTKYTQTWAVLFFILHLSVPFSFIHLCFPLSCSLPATLFRSVCHVAWLRARGF